jgi:hypothetical protein
VSAVLSTDYADYAESKTIIGAICVICGTKKERMEVSLHPLDVAECLSKLN